MGLASGISFFRLALNRRLWARDQLFPSRHDAIQDEDRRQEPKKRSPDASARKSSAALTEGGR